MPPAGSLAPRGGRRDTKMIRRDDSEESVIRLLLFIDNFERHGTQGQLVRLANALEADSRFLPFVGCLKLQGGFLEELKVPEERTVEFPLETFYGPDGIRQIFRLWSFVRRNQIQLVHSQDFYANMICVAASGWTRRPPLIVSRRYEVLSDRKIHRFGERVSYLLASAVVTNSPVERDRLQRDFEVPPEQIHFIPNGVDLDRFSPARAESEANGAIDPNRPTLGVVARLEPEKGHDTILAAARSLIEEWPDLALVLVGDGSLRPDLEQSIRQHGMEHNVLLAGEQTDVLPWLGSFDIGLLTPRWGEGLPNALLEYLAAGRPVVATRVGGIPELVRHDQEGLLVEPGDPEALAESIAALLEDEARRDQMARTARGRAEAFGLDRMVETTCQLYLDLSARSVEKAASRPPIGAGG